MIGLTARNAHRGVPFNIGVMHELGLIGPEDSHWKLPTPYFVCLMTPEERVIFHPSFDRDPFYALFQGLWMLWGCEDGSWFESMPEPTPTPMYGKRWRGGHWKCSQIDLAIVKLQNDRSAQPTIVLYDPDVDNAACDTARIPRHLTITFKRNPAAELDMIVHTRHMNTVWGFAPAYLTMLQEYVSRATAFEMGMFYEIAVNAAMEKTHMDQLYKLKESQSNRCPYEAGIVRTTNLINTDLDSWRTDLNIFMTLGPNALGYKDPFFRRVAIPMLTAYLNFPANHLDGGQRSLDDVRDEAMTLLYAGANSLSEVDSDWLRAGNEWFERRINRMKVQATAS